MPTSGSYTVAVDERHYTSISSNQTFVRPAHDVTAFFSVRLKRYSIRGRVTRPGNIGIGGVKVQLVESPATTVITDTAGFYSFSELAARGNYTVVPSLTDLLFAPVNITISDLSADALANFTVRQRPELLRIESSEMAIVLDSVTLVTQPSLFNLFPFHSDGFIRVMVFAKNLEGVKSPAQVLVVAEDDEGNTYPLDVEYAGDVVGQSWLKQINLKLSPVTLGGKCVQLKLSADGFESNTGRLCLAAP